MDSSSDQHQDLDYGSYRFPWFAPDPAASALDEAYASEQQPQFSPNKYDIPLYEPLMDPFSLDNFSTPTPVPTDRLSDPGFPSTSQPEGPAVDHTEPENNAQHVGCNAEGEWPANDTVYEHGSETYFDEPLIEDLDVDILFEPAPVATALLASGPALKQAGAGLDDGEGAVMQDLQCARDIVLMQEEVTEQANVDDDQAPAMQDIPCTRPSVSTPRRQKANAARRKTDKIIYCSVQQCTTTFTRKHNFEEHMKLHENKRAFRCTVAGCKKRFNTAGGLRSHKKYGHVHRSSKIKTQTSASHVCKPPRPTFPL